METGIVKLTPELLALFSGAENSNTLVPFTREIFLLDIIVAGTSFCESMPQIAEQLSTGTVLKMVRAPQNPYDSQAIGIYYEETRIGWVPKELNLIISRLMDAGKAFFCRIEKTSNVHSWIKIDAKIFMVE